MTDTMPMPVMRAGQPMPDPGDPPPVSGSPAHLPAELALLGEAPNGSLWIEIGVSVARIYADPLPHPEDWQLAVGLLRWLGADYDALSAGPEAEGDIDVWTAVIDPDRKTRLYV